MTEEDAFDAFARTSGPRLLRLARLLTRDDATAEDLFQTTLGHVWARRRSVLDPAAFEAFARRTMVRRATAWYSRAWTGEVAVEHLPERVAYTDAAACLDVRVALSRLSRRERAVLVLRFLEDLSEADTATALGCSTAAVKAASRRGLERLRTMSWEGYR